MQNSNLSFSQKITNYRLYIFLYEKFIHSAFLKFFADDFNTFDKIYNELRNMHPLPNSYNKKTYAILDMACGTGWFGRKLLKERNAKNLNIHVSGIDLSSSVLEFAKKKYKSNKISKTAYDLKCGNVCNMTDYLDESFAEIWLCGALHQIPNPELAVKELARVLQKDGYVFCQTFIENPKKSKMKNQLKYSEHYGHGYFKKNTLKTMFDKNNISIIDFKSSGPIALFYAKKN